MIGGGPFRAIRGPAPGVRGVEGRAGGRAAAVRDHRRRGPPLPPCVVLARGQKLRLPFLCLVPPFEAAGGEEDLQAP